MKKDYIYINYKLVFKENGFELLSIKDIQPLYLYPLTLKDYTNNLKSQKPIMLNIINIDKEIDYLELFSNTFFDNLMGIEILIESEANYDVFENIINIFFEKKVKIILNIKKITSCSCTFLKKVSPKICYFKLFFDYKKYEEFLKKVKIIMNNKIEDSLVLIKSYLNLNNVDLYEKYLTDFNIIGVDIFHLSKKLLEGGEKNKNVPKKYIDKIENLKSNKEIVKNIKFIVVKDITTLFYPKFEIDERNSRCCYACKLKPYLYGKYLIPCKVDKVINNIQKWGLDNLDEINKFDNYGIECDDCASLYENDILDFINKKKLSNNVEITLERK